MDKEEQTLDEFREEKRKKKAQMTAMQNLPYEIKVKRAAIRVREFIEKCDELGFKAKRYTFDAKGNLIESK